MCAINPTNVHDIEFIGFPPVNTKKGVMFLQRLVEELAQIVEGIIELNIVSDTNEFGFRERAIFEMTKEVVITFSLRRDKGGGIRVGVDAERGKMGLSIA